MTERKKYEELLNMSNRAVRLSWCQGLKKVNKKNWREYADGLCRVTLPSYAESHFSPEDVAYIEKIFKLYSQEYFYALIENLIENSMTKPNKSKKTIAEVKVSPEFAKRMKDIKKKGKK